MCVYQYCPRADGRLAVTERSPDFRDMCALLKLGAAWMKVTRVQKLGNILKTECGKLVLKAEEEGLMMSVKKNQREVFSEKTPRENSSRKPRRMFKIAVIRIPINAIRKSRKNLQDVFNFNSS